MELAKATGVIGAGNTTIHRINSIGTVIVGDDVEIRAGSTIDRGTVTATRIGSGTKIDNLVQIGHNVQLGANCMLCGHVGIAGSCEIGDRVVLGGKVGIADHIKIGHDSLVGASSGVGSDIPPRSIHMGAPRHAACRLLQSIEEPAPSEAVGRGCRRSEEAGGAWVRPPPAAPH